MTVDYPTVLTAIRPGAEWSLDGDSYDGLTWLSEGEWRDAVQVVKDAHPYPEPV